MNSAPARRILLVAPHLHYGGSAQVMLQLARGLSRSRFEVHLTLLTQSAPGRAGELEQLTTHCLRASRVRHALPSLLALLGALQPDAILSGMAHLNLALLAMRPLLPSRSALLVRQNAMLAATRESGGYGWPEAQLFRWLYPKADRILCQSQAMVEEISRLAPMPKGKVALAPSPVRAPMAHRSAWNWKEAEPRLVAVGRLAPEKGFDLLLRAFAAVRRQHPRAALVIAGAGPEESALLGLRAQLGLDEAVSFPGQLTSTAELLAEATAFVLSSRSDALPNALLEAAACGLPILATPASQGVSDLLAHAPGAWLAKKATAEALTATLLAALPELHERPRFPHAFLAPYAFERAIAVYEQALEEAIQERSA